MSVDDLTSIKNTGKFPFGIMQNTKSFGITYGPAIPEDSPGIGQVLYQAWRAAYVSEEYGITLEKIEESFKGYDSKERIEERAAQIAKGGEMVIGICRMLKMERHGELQTLYVLPDYWGKGIGPSLWKLAQPKFDRDKDIYVYVVVYNARAIRFYQKQGFVDTGVRKEWSKLKFPVMEMIIKAQPAS
jgi:ribosomal protein S18 acetylase RimI-like enzyme